MKPTHRHHFIGGSHVATISSVWGLSHADAATKLRPPPGVHPTPTHVLAERCVAPMHPSHLARLHAHRDGSSPLPVAVDHSVHPALDQGQTSSCTAHALAKCVQILTGRLGSPHVLYSLTGAADAPEEPSGLAGGFAAQLGGTLTRDRSGDALVIVGDFPCSSIASPDTTAPRAASRA